MRRYIDPSSKEEERIFLQKSHPPWPLSKVHFQGLDRPSLLRPGPQTRPSLQPTLVTKIAVKKNELETRHVIWQLMIDLFPVDFNGIVLVISNDI